MRQKIPDAVAVRAVDAAAIIYHKMQRIRKMTIQSEGMDAVADATAIMVHKKRKVLQTAALTKKAMDADAANS